MIAASGTVTLTGSVLANGGNSGDESGQGTGGTGGGGSGGAIRIVATTIAGNGPLSANGGTVGAATGAGGCGAVTFPCFDAGGAGAVGRIRLVAEIFTRTATSTPAHTFSAPGTVFVAGLPTLRITSVAGTTAPATPTGIADITLPTTTTQPVTIAFETTGVPVGNNVKLTVVPAYGAPVTAVSNALSGSTATANSTATVTLPTGPSSLTAQTTYTITVAMGKALSMFAQGEVVERVAVVANPGKENAYKLITVTGKEFEVALARLAGVI